MEQPNSFHLAAPGGRAATVQEALDLQRFCWANDYRKYLRQPWPHKGWMYASNGHILVRVPAPEHAETVFPEPVAESAVAMLADVGERLYVSLPRFTLGAACTSCNGTGKRKQIKCEDCDGEGEFERGRHTYECQRCDGEGWFDDDDGEDHECDVCDGFGTESKSIPCGGGISYQARYLHLIERLPGFRFSPGTSADETTVKAAHFIFDGGEGLLMPMGVA